MNTNELELKFAEAQKAYMAAASASHEALKAHGAALRAGTDSNATRAAWAAADDVRTAAYLRFYAICDKLLYAAKG